MKHLALMGLVLALFLGCTDARTPVGTQALKSTRDGSTMTRQSEPDHSPPPSVASAQKAHVDPRTGEFVQPPQADSSPESQPPSPSSLSTSVETIQEAPSPVAGGGMMIDLQGRHQSPITATIDSDGRTTVEHNFDAPGK